MDYVTRGHGRCVFDQRFPLRSRSLQLHRTIFHPRGSYFPGLWPRPCAVRTIRLELDWPRNNHRSNRLDLGSGTVSRSISTGPMIRPLSHDAVIRVYDSARNIIETHEHAGDFKEP